MMLYFDKAWNQTDRNPVTQVIINTEHIQTLEPLTPSTTLIRMIGSVVVLVDYPLYKFWSLLPVKDTSGKSRALYLKVEKDGRKRWRKRYKGKEYWFNVLKGETKNDSYQRCFNLWLQKKQQIDMELARQDKDGKI